MKVPVKLSSWLPCLLFGVLMIALAAFGFRKQVDNPAGSDLEVYLHAGRLMREGADMYLIPTHGDRYYRYPPLLAFLVGPLARLPYGAALLIWSVLSAFIVSAVCLVWFRIATGTEFCRQRVQIQWAVGGITLLVSLRYLVSHFNYGQVNLSVLALIGVVAGGLAGIALPVIRTGVSGNLEQLTQWIGHMADSASPTTIWLASNNVSLYASLQRLFSDLEIRHLDGTMSTVSLLALPGTFVQILAWVIFVMIVVWIVWVSWKYGCSEDDRVRAAVASFMFALVPVLTTTAQKHYFVMIIPAVMYVLCAWLVFNFRDATFRLLVAVSFALLAATGPAIWSKPWAQTFQASGVISVAAILLAAAIGRSMSAPGLPEATRGARNVS